MFLCKMQAHAFKSIFKDTSSFAYEKLDLVFQPVALACVNPFAGALFHHIRSYEEGDSVEKERRSSVQLHISRSIFRSA